MLKTSFQATENTEFTEINQVSARLISHPMGKHDHFGNCSTILCELCVLCG